MNQFMANKPKTTAKRMRQNEKKRTHNKSIKSNMKTQIKRMNSYIESDNLEGAQLEFTKTISTLDKVAQKKILHRNNISRKKSKIARKYNQLVAKQQGEKA